MTTHHHDDTPTVAEIAALTARLRELNRRGVGVEADPQERAAFVADKEALLARIPAQNTGVDRNSGTDALMWQMPDEMREHAACTAAELADGTSPPPRPDDPVALAERIGQLRAAQGPSRTEEVVSHPEAVERLAELGYDRASAGAMVAEYLHETSRAVGVPVYQWGLDQYDVDDIAARYDWVDREAGATLDEARQQAAMNATVWSDRADRSRDDPATDQADATNAAAQSELWSARSRVPQPFTPDQDEDQDADDVGADEDWSDFYTAEEIAAMGDALDQEDVWEARRRLLAHHAGQREPAADTTTDRHAEQLGEEDRRQQLAHWQSNDATAQVDTQGDDDALGRGDLP